MTKRHATEIIKLLRVIGPARTTYTIVRDGQDAWEIEAMFADRRYGYIMHEDRHVGEFLADAPDGKF